MRRENAHRCLLQDLGDSPDPSESTLLLVLSVGSAVLTSGTSDHVRRSFDYVAGSSITPRDQQFQPPSVVVDSAECPREVKISVTAVHFVHCGGWSSDKSGTSHGPATHIIESAELLEGMGGPWALSRCIPRLQPAPSGLTASTPIEVVLRTGFALPPEN